MSNPPAGSSVFPSPIKNAGKLVLIAKSVGGLLSIVVIVTVKLWFSATGFPSASITSVLKVSVAVPNDRPANE